MPVFIEKDCTLCLAPSPIWGLTNKIIKTAKLIRGTQHFHFVGLNVICAKQYFEFFPKPRWSDSLNCRSHTRNANPPTFKNQDTGKVKDRQNPDLKTGKDAEQNLVGGEGKFWTFISFGLWENLLENSNIHVLPKCRYLSLNKTLFCFLKNTAHHFHEKPACKLQFQTALNSFLNTLSWHQNFPQARRQRCIQSAGFGQTKDLCCAELLLHLPSPRLPSRPIPTHGWGIISYNLSFFVVEVDLYLAALMKSFDVLLRFTASFLAFCLPCLL